jgi:hypothetical protein
MTDIIVGTVRGRNTDGSYVVVRRDGRPLNVFFPGTSPTVGSDIIGNLAVDDTGRSTMNLHPTVMDALLDGHAKIVPITQRADLTARVMAKMLERSKSAVFKPGGGMSIERMPHSEDADVRWAMDNFRPEAERLGLALNVIDVKAVTRSPWDVKQLQNFSLPADIEGSRRSRDELTRILRSGFHPACSRIIERFTGQNEISVNFVIPYSPFAGAVGFARDAAQMTIHAFPLCSMDISESRRLSAARQMAMAIAHNRLTPGKGFQADLDTHPRARHLSNSFADVAACLVFVARGGRPEVVDEYILLKEASLYFGYSEPRGLNAGVLEKATHRSIRAAMEWYSESGSPDMSIRDLVTRAVRIAKAHAYEGLRFTDPSAVTDMELRGAVDAANLVAADLSTSTNSYLESLSVKYCEDLATLIDEHGGHPVSAQRMMNFGSVHIPDRMERLFADLTAPLAETVREYEEKTAEAARSHVLNTVSDRLKASRSISQPMDFDLDVRPSFVQSM